MKKPAAPKHPAGKPPLAHHGHPAAHGGGKKAAGGGKGGRPAPATPAARHHHVRPVKAAKPPKPAKKPPSHRKKPAKPATPVRRQLALGEAVACCTAEALAASLRLAGGTVRAADVLALYERTADGPDAGASIRDTLEAAAEFGLAGVCPARFAAVDLDDPAAVILGLSLPAPHAVAVAGGVWWSWGEPWAFPDAVLEEAWTLTWPEVGA